MAQNGVIVLGARFPAEEAELIRAVAAARGEDVSDLLRRGVYTILAELSYLDEERKKALGMAP